MIFSRFLKRLDSKLDVPVWALLFNAAWVFVLGCVYLGSSTAFYAIVAPGLILEQLSFAFPAGLLLWRRRDPAFLPAKGPFKLGKLGWIVNFVTVAWAVVELVFYDLPPELPVTGGNMSTWLPIFRVAFSSPIRITDRPAANRLHLRRPRRHRHLHRAELVHPRQSQFHGPKSRFRRSVDRGNGSVSVKVVRVTYSG